MRTVVIRMHRADFSTEMAEMRAWLDEHHYEPSKFLCDVREDMSVIRVEFKHPREAEAFKARFLLPDITEYGEKSHASGPREDEFIPENWAPEASGPESMLQACRWRIVAEEIRTKAECCSTRSAQETMHLVADVWDRMAETLERRLEGASQPRR